MFLALAGDVVVLLRGEEVQEPGLRNHIPVTNHKGFYPFFGTPPGNRMHPIAGDLGDLTYGQDIGVTFGRLVQVAVQFLL